MLSCVHLGTGECWPRMSYLGAQPITIRQSKCTPEIMEGFRLLKASQRTDMHQPGDRGWEGPSQQTVIQVTRSRPSWSVFCSFLLKFSQRPCCSGLWKKINDYYEKQNIPLYKSFPEGSGCLQYLEDGQGSVNSSTAWRSVQVYNPWSVHRASVPNSSPRGAVPGELLGDSTREDDCSSTVTSTWESLCFNQLCNLTWGKCCGPSAWRNQLSQRGNHHPRLPSSLIFSLVVLTHLYQQDPPRSKKQKFSSHQLKPKTNLLTQWKEALIQEKKTLNQRKKYKLNLLHHSVRVGWALPRRGLLIWA